MNDDFKFTRQYYRSQTELDFTAFSAEEEHELLVKAKAGDAEAKARFLQGFLRYTMGIAKRTAAQRLDENDAISAGNVGLIKAFERFDTNSGNRFSTYAFHFIRGEVLAVCEEFHKHRFRGPFLMDPVDELKMREGLGTGRLPSCRKYDSQASVQFKPAITDRGISTPQTNPEVEERDELKFNLETLRHLLVFLTERERQVLHFRFTDELSFEQIGKLIAPPVSKQRVKQLLELALAKLRQKFKNTPR